MDCPECGAQMVEKMTDRAVALDSCPGCRALWFDKGEIFSFATSPRNMGRAITQARKRQMKTKFASPVSGEPMVAIKFSKGPGFLDLETGGVWIRGRDLSQMVAGKELKLRPRAPRKEEAMRRVQVETPKLPRLWIRSSFTLIGLYALLSFVLITASLYAGLSPALALGLAVVVAAVQFAVGPFIMDLTLRFLYKATRVEYEDVPEHLAAFIRKTCQAHGMEPPGLWMIWDNSPNAFTYGHTPNNARLVLTQGTIELLEARELEAVAGHELGHACHWDMALMTMAQLVPMLLYYLYRTAVDIDLKDERLQSVTTNVAIGAYVLYILSEYVVLWFSRTREYHADRFGAESAGSARQMASALVKIAYGLAGAGGEDDSGKGAKRVAAIGALGVFNASAAQSMAVSAYGQKDEGEAAEGGDKYRIDSDSIMGAMKWDLWNPWGLWYELHSTHPLVAKRIKHLTELSYAMGEEPLVRFDLKQPESYWDEFFADVVMGMLPLLVIGVGGVSWALGAASAAEAGAIGLSGLAGVLLLAGLAMFMKLRFRYPVGCFPDMSVRALLQEVKVSGIRPVPCRLEGVIRGKGVPGLIYSDDFVMQDDTGIMFLDHRQPLAIWEFLFGWLKAKKLIGEHVVVEGWFRRSPVPYVEIYRYEIEGKLRRSYLRAFRSLLVWGTIAFGLFVGLLGSVPQG